MIASPPPWERRHLAGCGDDPSPLQENYILFNSSSLKLSTIADGCALNAG